MCGITLSKTFMTELHVRKNSHKKAGIVCSCQTLYPDVSPLWVRVAKFTTHRCSAAFLAKQAVYQSKTLYEFFKK